MSKNIKSKLARCLTCLTLTLSMLVSVVAVYAAGIEDWNSSQGPEENIRVYNNNLTPVKTIKKSGKLTIHFITLPCKPGYSHCRCGDSEPFNWSPVVGTIQIRNSAGRVLSTSPQCGELQSGTVSYNVTAGMKIQLFMDVSTKPGYSRPGDYRKAHFSYYYTIS